MLENYKTGVSNPDSPWPAAGQFNPLTGEAVIYPSTRGEDRDDVRTHELTHSSQFNSSLKGRPNNRTVREAAEGLEDSIGEVQRGTMTGKQKYVIDPLELEAFIKGAHNVASEQGVDFSGDFESIREQLNRIPQDKTNPNIRGLISLLQPSGDSFGNAWRDDQKQYLQEAFNGVAQYKDMDENFTPSNLAARRQRNLEGRMEKKTSEEAIKEWLQRSRDSRRGGRGTQQNESGY
tara:strand:- start:28 stop:729 length:702 start_codon:yes stop_codon:yes gene_type:complete